MYCTEKPKRSRPSDSWLVYTSYAFCTTTCSFDTAVSVVVEEISSSTTSASSISSGSDKFKIIATRAVMAKPVSMTNSMASRSPRREWLLPV